MSIRVLELPIRVGLFCAVSLLTACGQPGVLPKPAEFQDSETAVRDWRMIAKHIAGGLQQAGLLPQPATPGGPPPNPAQTFYIHTQASGSAFLTELKGFLQTEILQRGGRVTLTPQRAIVVNLDVGVVQWGGPPRPVAVGLPSAVALAAVGLVAPVGEVTNTEMVWQASIVEADQLLLQMRQVVYVTLSDVPLYVGSADAGRLASGGRSAEPGRFIPYVR